MPVVTTFNFAELKSALKFVVVSVSTDKREVRLAYTGVLFHFEEAELTLAAADGFRLSVCHLLLSTPVVKSVDYLIPVEAIKEVIALKGWTEIELYTVSEKEVMFLGKDSGEFSKRVKAAVVDDVFPAYQQVIPTNFKTIITVGRSELEQAVRIVPKIAVRGKSGMVVLSSDESSITIHAASAELGDSTYRMDAHVQGPDVTIGFRIAHLLDGVRVLHEEKCILACNESNDPVVIRDATESDTPFIHVVMPVIWYPAN